jgi:3-hydroxybutyryl-CoA dehydrogenase
MDKNTICICGAGTMGSGIAQVVAAADFQTILYEWNPGVLQRAEETLHGDLKKLVDKGKLTKEKRKAIIGSPMFYNRPEAM